LALAFVFELALLPFELAALPFCWLLLPFELALAFGSVNSFGCRWHIIGAKLQKPL
jgi:hypothetical protein